MFKAILSPFIWIRDFIQNNFKTAIFLLLIYLLFFSTTTIEKNPNLYKIYLNTQIMEAESFLEEVKNASKSHIKGVLLVVDSPGGAVAPSVEMSMAIKELSEQKPVIAYAMGMMTSGSYYASIWSSKIVANPGSTIGSIGVKFDGFNVEELAKRLGIAFQGVQAGDYKNMGTYRRFWSEDEKKELEILINDTYEMFIEDVSNARGLNLNDSKKFAEGRVFSAKRAKSLGLIDDLGSFSSAVEVLAKESNVTEVIFNEPNEIDKILEKIGEKVSQALIKVYPKLMSMY